GGARPAGLSVESSVPFIRGQGPVVAPRHGRARKRIRIMTTPLISIENLGHSYGPDQPTILRDISFAAGAGEFICVVGPSGTGKTTLLRCLAGLQRPSEGRVVFQGTVISGPPRKLVVVFQDYSRSLMPWLSVLE